MVPCQTHRQINLYPARENIQRKKKCHKLPLEIHFNDKSFSQKISHLYNGAAVTLFSHTSSVDILLGCCGTVYVTTAIMENYRFFFSHFKSKDSQISQLPKTTSTTLTYKKSNVKRKQEANKKKKRPLWS